MQLPSEAAPVCSSPAGTQQPQQHNTNTTRQTVPITHHFSSLMTTQCPYANRQPPFATRDREYGIWNWNLELEFGIWYDLDRSHLRMEAHDGALLASHFILVVPVSERQFQCECECHSHPNHFILSYLSVSVSLKPSTQHSNTPTHQHSNAPTNGWGWGWVELRVPSSWSLYGGVDVVVCCMVGWMWLLVAC